MKNVLTLATIVLEDKLTAPIKRKTGSTWCYVHTINRYAGKDILSIDQTNDYIAQKILEGTPFCVGRLGANELFSAGMFEFDADIKKQKAINQLSVCGGFFPADVALGDRFVETIRQACRQVDVAGISAPRFERYFIKKYMPKSVKLSRIMELDPMKNSHNPWTKALKGKKVLVIYPFAELIEQQYTQKREKIFPGTEILPEFELKVMTSVQTIAGEKDERFTTWFEALEWMKEEALKIDFDVAIIGCGAYGLPLAAMLKEAGKQAIHLGGAVQVLFGIKGKRWEEEPKFQYVKDWFNDAWVNPSAKDIPQRAHEVEGGLYW